MLIYKRLNLILGWVIFAVASAVYLLTIEPTASFWDCGEFIACSNKLLVGHPPGAPLFLLIARLFTMLNPANPAVMVNIMSALASSFTILFLFWSVTHLMEKVFRGKEGSHSAYSLIVIFGSAAVGALAYTFSDSFWFSAVEGEVYATSSLFTAIVFWAILKWESEAHETFANRWVVLIAYLMGLSIGVHLLNLLAIPAMALVYYFKKYPVTTKGLIYAAIIAVVILAGSLYAIPGTFTVGSWFELLFVNSFGLPYNSGLIFYTFLLFAALSYLIYYTYQKRKALLNIIALCVTVMLLGYGSYAMVLLRSSANPSMDQNNPDNVFNLINYLNRDQYGDRPLVRGQYFNAPAPAGEDGGVVYAALNGRYEVVDHKTKYVYDPRFTTLFPRMFSTQDDHPNFYKTWNGGFKGRPVRMQGEQGKTEVVYIPTFAENLSFFFTYQVGYMYMRYFMWNFAGRQNDLQGHGELTRGNWISGIPFIDNVRLGMDQNMLPDSLKSNKGRNAYYLLPLLLGLAGMYFQYRRSKKDFTVVLLLFFFTGIAIVMYLNQSPIQPRERDYSYAGSFYAFAFWIGIGVAAVAELLRKLIKHPATAGALAFVASLLLVPGIMASENWDDHDCSNRYLARDFAYNYLNSCRPQSVVFTYGDNDTFPLWYVQEVEGVRTDVRIMNLSYASAGWYIEQMGNAYYDSDPLPMTLTADKVAGSRRAIVLVQDRISGPLDIKQGMDFVVSDASGAKLRSNYRGQESISYFPGKTLRIPTITGADSTGSSGSILDQIRFTEGTTAAGESIVTPNKDQPWLPFIDVNLNSSYVYRNSLAQIDLLANFRWKRPIYWGVTAPPSYSLGLEKYWVDEGFAKLLVPMQHAQSNNGGDGWTNADEVYEKIMNVFMFRNLNNENVYYDENCVRIIATSRNVFARAIYALISEEKKDKAKDLLNKYMEVFPKLQVSVYYLPSAIVDAFYYVDEPEKAVALSDTLAADIEQQLRYFGSIAPEKRREVERERSYAMQNIMMLAQSAQRNNQPEHEKKLNDIIALYR
ncbi:MAG: DUF2723 domain-containing protein [Prevotellaceae bacterium]|jgi:hypothetical protein|nr:DUF2723 domain-containing protein [Prevotellaceae bacterium]